MKMISYIIGIVVALFVAAALLPSALNMIGNATFYNVNSTVSTIFTVLVPLLAMVGIALWFLPRKG